MTLNCFLKDSVNIGFNTEVKITNIFTMVCIGPLFFPIWKRTMIEMKTIAKAINITRKTTVKRSCFLKCTASLVDAEFVGRDLRDKNALMNVTANKMIVKTMDNPIKILIGI